MTRLLSALLCGVAMALPAPVFAEGAGVVALAGWRDSDALTVPVSADARLEDARSAQLALEWPYRDGMRWQLAWHRFAGDYQAATDAGGIEQLQMDHLLIGGYQRFTGERLRPYVGSTGGIVRFAPDFSGADSETRLALSLFAGADLQLAGALHLRVEARWLGAFFNSETSLRCGGTATGNADDDGGCRIRFDAGVWSQYELAAGLSLQF